MPPKKPQVRVVKDEEKFYDVDKEFFAIQFESKERTIVRLEKKCVVLNEEVEAYKRKTDVLNGKLNDEYERGKNMLAEKIELEKKLNAEVDNLSKEVDSMAKTGKKELRTIDNDFIREAEKIKWTIAVYTGKLNKLKEFSKHEKLLERKFAGQSKRAEDMKRNYDTKLYKIEWKHLQNKKFVQKEMIQRCNNFAVHLKKYLLSISNPVLASGTRPIMDLKYKLQTVKETNAQLEEQLHHIVGEKKQIENLKKSKRQAIVKNVKAYTTKKNEADYLRKEIEEVTTCTNDLQKKLNKGKANGLDKLRENINSAINELQSLESQLHAARIDLQTITSDNKAFDEYKWKSVDMLLRAYENASDLMESTKIDKEDCKEKTFDFLLNLFNEFENFTIYDSKVVLPRDSITATMSKDLLLKSYNQVIETI